ncbi:MAG: AMP-binding protein [Elusimicrobia bacterium]|nr:AMP-binding protein [Elusimicrobiota bacterium]
MNSIVEAWEQLSKEYGSRLALKDESTGFGLSFTELYETINKTAQILENLNFKPKSNILLCSNPHPLWHVIDQAIMTNNLVSVLADPTSGLPEIKHLVETMQIKVLFTDNIKLATELAQEQLSIHIFYVGASDISAYKRQNIYSLTEEIKKVEFKTKQNKEYSPDALASIMFSSGTSGKSKGAMFTHQNLLLSCYDHKTSLGSTRKKTCVDLLSCSHIAPRLTEWALLLNGNTIIYTNYTKYLKTVQKHKPEYLICVPKILNMIIAQYKKEILKLSKFSQKLNNVAFNISNKHYKLKFKYSNNIVVKTLSAILSVCNFVCYKLFIKKIVEKFINPNCLLFAFGAFTDKNIENVISAMGLNLMVFYGLTESCVCAAYTSQGHKKAYSVGKTNPNMDVIISDLETGQKLGFNKKGMIKVKGKQVMRGYYNNEEETKKVFDSQGYLITGDLGYISEDGFLYFVGRHKNIIVLNNGENIDSVKIELICNNSNFVQQTVIFGQDKPYLTAVIVPDKDYILKWANEKNIDINTQDGKNLLKKDIIIDINNLIGKDKFFRWIEQIKDIVIIDEPFSIENGLMTRKYTVIRTKVYDKYKNLIDNMYKG